MVAALYYRLHIWVNPEDSDKSYRRIRGIPGGPSRKSDWADQTMDSS